MICRLTISSANDEKAFGDFLPQPVVVEEGYLLALNKPVPLHDRRGLFN